MTNTNKPSALELAEMITRYNAGVCSQKVYEDYEDAAEMLRKQHEAIQKLRNVLEDIDDLCMGGSELERVCREALQETEEFNHD